MTLGSSQVVRQWTLTPSCVGPNPTSPTLCKIYMQFFVYILKSVKDDKFYIGQTNNLTDRFLRHNNGCVTATKNRRPLVLAYSENYNTRAEAMRREKYLKTSREKTTFKTHVERVFLQKYLLKRF